ncbi:MAG: orotidine-5'-phosphate decarboxylase, partial [Alphaproteobacteria bacterium]|nr:orotidine-5'-phosphate decarboxylase [Alphaproteobacteria bacterium]
MTKNPIICAIDTTDVEKAKALVEQVSESVGAIKLGLEFFTYNGVKGVEEIAKLNVPIFLDLKFHDIPNTVGRAIKALSNLDNIFMTTIHTSGGKAMMEAAAAAVTEAFQFKNEPKVVGVTVLTSMDSDDLRAIGVSKEMNQQVLDLAKLAKNSGLSGIVCSPHEILQIREHLPKNFTLVVPGIRLAGAVTNSLAAALGAHINTSYVKNDDQKRVMTPREAMDAGATYLVIGRPITEAADPAAAAK